MSTARTITAWAIQRGSTNLLDGHRTYLDGDPVCASRTRLFRNRAAARDYAKQHYGYITSVAVTCRENRTAGTCRRLSESK